MSMQTKPPAGNNRIQPSLAWDFLCVSWQTSDNNGYAEEARGSGRWKGLWPGTHGWMQGQNCGTWKQERVVHHPWNSAPFPPQPMLSLKMCTGAISQVASWKAALLELPPDMDPTGYGWECDHQEILLPRTVPRGTLSSPSHILQLISCNCKSSGCRTAACSCSKLGCTMFGVCEGGEACMNPLTKNQN